MPGLGLDEAAYMAEIVHEAPPKHDHPAAVQDRYGVPAVNLFGHMTAVENVTLAPMKVNKETRAVATGKALKLLDRVGPAQRTKAFLAKVL